MINTLFRNKKPNVSKMLSFGFTEQDGSYRYAAPLAGGNFQMTVHISGEGKITAEVIDKISEEKYILHLVTEAGGSFAGMIRKEYENILLSIAENCFDIDIFKSLLTKKVLQYVKEKYNDDLEYLWPKSPTNAIFRRKDNAKWYAALLLLPKSKLGIKSGDLVDVLDLRILPREVDAVVDGRRYFPGYHMNKKSWFSLCLDGSVPIEEICRRIDESYEIAGKK